MSSAFDRIQALETSQTALFLDFDGTLAPIVDRPELVQVDEGVIATLSDLHESLSGALAIVSGREIAALDHFLSPFRFPASGVHGLEWRFSDSKVHRRTVSKTSLSSVIQDVELVAAQHPEILLERKPGSVALHFRAKPDLQDTCRMAVEKAVQGRDGLVIIEGKMVIEIKGHSGNKGTAVETMMSEPPFRDRTPIFIGDDITDEAGFTIVNGLGGISIKVGAGETCATEHLRDPGEVAAWLEVFATRTSSKTAEGSTAR